jgi:ABC-type glycerol-3-phosphate transport system substrate-binding protein
MRTINHGNHTFAARSPGWVLRQIGLALVGLVALWVLVFGPRPTSQFPRDRVIVDYWEKWTGAEEQAMRKIVDRFNDTVGREKGIFVRYLSTSNITQKTLVATAGGVPPDIAGLYNQNVPQFAALDALEPLDEYARARGITPDLYKRVFWDECSYEGRLYGLVSSCFTVALYYNQGLFRERAESLRARGLDPDRAPRTIAELDAYAEALDRYDDAGRLVSAGYIPLEPGWFAPYTCLWFGGRWWDPKSQKFTFTDPGVVRSFEWIQSYSKRLGAAAMADFRSGFGAFDSPQNAFLAESVAMVQQGAFLATFIRNQRPSMEGRWFAAPFPAVDASMAPVTYCNCDVLVIPRGAKHKKEAFEFIAFVNQQEQMESLARDHGKISPLADVSEGFFDGHVNPAIRVFDELARSPNAFPTEPVPILTQVDDELAVFMQQLVLLRVNPREGLERLQTRLQGKFDEFQEMQRRRGRVGPAE